MPDLRFHRDESFSVVECKKCGLGFVSPRPTRSEIARYYPPTFYRSSSLEGDSHHPRYQVEADLVESACATHLGRRRGNLLDIGCANGDFPRLMKRRGWNVAAVEVSENAASISDFPVLRQDFSDVDNIEPAYEVVTAFAVLEHSHDPMAFFRNAYSALVPGGVFVFLVTNFDSISSRYLYREDVPRHLYFFSERTVRGYSKRTGFDLLSVAYDDSIYEMKPVNWLRYYYMRLTKRAIDRRELPMGRADFFASHGLTGGVLAHLRYIVANPAASIDLALLPLFERYQMLTKTYGIMTCVAIKRGHDGR